MMQRICPETNGISTTVQGCSECGGRAHWADLQGELRSLAPRMATPGLRSLIIRAVQALDERETALRWALKRVRLSGDPEQFSAEYNAACELLPSQEGR